jgi:hypothetical protein
MQIETLCTDYFKAYKSADATLTYGAHAHTVTEPTGDGVIDMCKNGVLSANVLYVLPYGTGDENDEFALRVFAVSRLPGGGSSALKDLWVYSLVAEFTPCVMSASVGVLNGALGATARFCDTLTMTVGNANVSNEIISPTGDLAASITVDMKGAQKAVLRFNAGTGSPTGMNALVRKF